MKRIKEEAEVIIRLDYQDQLAHICVSAWPRMNAKMLKMYGISKDGRNTPKSARWTIPIKGISFRRLKARKSTGKPFPASAPRVERSPENRGTND